MTTPISSTKSSKNSGSELILFNSSNERLASSGIVNSVLGGVEDCSLDDGIWSFTGEGGYRSKWLMIAWITRPRSEWTVNCE